MTRREDIIMNRLTLSNRLTLTFGLLLGVAISADTQPPEQPAQTTPTAPLGPMVGSIGIDGAIDKFYGATRQAIVKTADGVRQVVHFTDKTVVHGARDAGDAAKDTFKGLSEGSRVIVHGVVEGGKTTAVEVDHIGGDALKEMSGTVEHIDRAAKTLTVKLADGTTATLRLTERAARDVAKGVASADRVVVYYADASGHQVAHFFKKLD
jgi:hypothetical protein